MNGGLSLAQCVEYREKGYVVIRDRFAEAEIGAWQEETARLLQVLDAGDESDPRIQSRPHLTGGRILDRIDPVTDLAPAFAALVEDPRVVAAAADALGDRPVLLKDKLIFKRPGTAGYGMHQDWPYLEAIGIPPDGMVAVMVSIDPANATNGALELYPGLHHGRLPAPSEEPRDVDVTKMDLTTGETIATRPHDLLLFHGLAPHRSGPNRSAQRRAALYLTYNAARYGDRYARYYALRAAS